MKYKVGDKVIIREWDDMEREFGVDFGGDINAECCFVKQMRKYCGKKMTISEITEGGNYTMVNGDNWIFSADTFEKNNTQKIVITSDGKETLARLYDGGKVVKKATAQCSPDDTFDFKTGAMLAFERLMNEGKKPLTFREKLKQEHPEYVDERWGGGCKGCPCSYGYEEKYHCGSGTYGEDKCTKCWDREIPEQKTKEKPLKYEVGKQYQNGDLVIEITDVKRGVSGEPRYSYKLISGKDGRLKDFDENSIFARTLKPYEPPKYFNGKAVCIETKPFLAFTVGKVYEFKDGITVIDNGHKTDPVKSIKEWNELHVGSAKMLEIVE